MGASGRFVSIPLLVHRKVSSSLENLEVLLGVRSIGERVRVRILRLESLLGRSMLSLHTRERRIRRRLDTIAIPVAILVHVGEIRVVLFAVTVHLLRLLPG